MEGSWRRAESQQHIECLSSRVQISRGKCFTGLENALTFVVLHSPKDWMGMRY
jgi:hypothetical protein